MNSLQAGTLKKIALDLQLYHLLAGKHHIYNLSWPIYPQFPNHKENPSKTEQIPQESTICNTLPIPGKYSW
jgi:hypothetical protein